MNKPFGQTLCPIFLSLMAIINEKVGHQSRICSFPNQNENEQRKRGFMLFVQPIIVFLKPSQNKSIYREK